MDATDSCTSSPTSKRWRNRSFSSPQIANSRASWGKKVRAKHARSSLPIESSRCTRRSTRASRLVLSDAPDVQDREPELQHDQRVGLGRPAPCDPQHVAEEENPEAPLPFLFRLSGDEPG